MQPRRLEPLIDERFHGTISSSSQPKLLYHTSVGTWLCHAASFARDCLQATTCALRTRTRQSWESTSRGRDAHRLSSAADLVPAIAHPPRRLRQESLRRSGLREYQSVSSGTCVNNAQTASTISLSSNTVCLTQAPPEHKTGDHQNYYALRRLTLTVGTQRFSRQNISFRGGAMGSLFSCSQQKGSEFPEVVVSRASR